ncbi:hypothetical protein GCM10009559_34410 [Pseudonocardia zijingensis]|uniref:MEDS domain-containing protein n=1 Tax=Pseudonocardia zijingensis TaxID=153376 RepID=A0ABP4AQI8_9PSEU
MIQLITLVHLRRYSAGDQGGTPVIEHAAAPVHVEHLRPGDHACVEFDDVESRWEVLTAFAQIGLARGERVMLLLDPDDLDDAATVARVDDGTGVAAGAHEHGHLVVARNTSLYFPDGRFDADRTRRAYAAATQQTVDDGHHALRVAVSMAWAPRAGWSDDELMAWEGSAEHLFRPARFAALCWYDRARFSEHMLAGAREIHPVHVLDRLSMLEVTRHPGGARIAGSGSREELTRVLTDVLARGPEQSPLHFELDLAGARDVDAHCAWMLIDLAGALPPADRLVVRCDRSLEMVLRGLGADAVPQLELAVASDLNDAAGVA